MDLSNFEPIESAPLDGTTVIIACEGPPSSERTLWGGRTPTVAGKAGPSR